MIAIGVGCANHLALGRAEPAVRSPNVFLYLQHPVNLSEENTHCNVGVSSLILVSVMILSVMLVSIILLPRRRPDEFMGPCLLTQVLSFRVNINVHWLVGSVSADYVDAE